MRRAPGFVVAIALVGVSAGLGFAAQQFKPTKVLLVRNPSGPESRKIVYKVKELTTSNTVVGDPVTNGAKLRVTLTPGGDQCFNMPASGWSAISTLGFKYNDPSFANGPVRVASIKKTPSGTFLIKAVLKVRALGAGITVVPGDPTASYAINFRLGGGDEYCSSTGSATPNLNDDKTFKVVNDSAPVSCSASACSPSGAFLDDPSF